MEINEDLERRIDKYAFHMDRITKKKMFGGLGYILNGNMCFGVYKDHMLLRTSPEKAKELLGLDHVRIFDVMGKPMKGWLMVDPEFFKNDEKLQEILDIGRAFALSLPAK